MQKVVGSSPIIRFRGRRRSVPKYDRVVLAKAAFWGSLGALGWTHLGYPLLAAAGARLRERPVRKREIEPTVTFIVAAHNEEVVIERRLANLLALDYPASKLEIVVVSDGSTDRTDDLVESAAAGQPQVRLLRVPRGGKVAAQDTAVRATSGEVLAFSDANTQWKPDALRKLVRNFDDPDVAYVCGSHFYERADGTNREGLYARFEGSAAADTSRGSGRSPAASGRSTPSAERTTWSSIPASATTSPCRTSWCSAAAAPSSSPRRSLGRSPRATSRTSTAGRSGCSSTAG